MDQRFGQDQIVSTLKHYSLVSTLQGNILHENKFYGAKKDSQNKKQ